jgi:ABC-type branched-subunit amino acid transport system substrate-binding protein
MRRTVRLLAFILLLGLLGTACGARLDPNTRSAAANAILSGGGGSGGGGTLGGSSGSTGGSSTGGSTGATGSKTGGSAGTAGTAGSSGSSGKATGGKSDAGSSVTGKSNCPTGGSDVGLTNNQISLGTIADVTGPVPGLFTGARQGMAAYVAYINNSGGLCGHTVKDDFADGGTNCSQNQSDVNDLIKKDFALVGTFSLYDGCGASVLKNHTNVPDVHVSLDPAAETLSNHFDLEPGALGYATGMWKYYAQKLGSKVKSVGTIAEDIPSALAKQNAELKAARSQGWNFVYSDNASPTTGDFTSDFNKMCGQKHIKVFFTVTEDAQNAATMISDENKVAACKGIVNIIPIAYDQAFLSFCKQVGCGSNENSVMGWNEYSLFFNGNEAASLPELKLFQTWFSRVNPGQKFNLYALFAWADARLFQQAFENAGKSASRGAVITALKKIHKYDDNGIVAPTNPGSKGAGNTCYINWRLSNGSFSRQDSPAKGYRCDGSFLPYK